MTARKKKRARVAIKFRAVPLRKPSAKDAALLDLRVQRDFAVGQLDRLAGMLVAHGLHAQRTWDPVMASVIDAALRKVAAQKDAIAHEAEVEKRTVETLERIERHLEHFFGRAESIGYQIRSIGQAARRFLGEDEDESGGGL